MRKAILISSLLALLLLVIPFAASAQDDVPVSENHTSTIILSEEVQNLLKDTLQWLRELRHDLAANYARSIMLESLSSHQSTERHTIWLEQVIKHLQTHQD